MKKEKIGVLYARYSSHAQNDASIEQQFDKCRQYAESIGVRVIGAYEDRAISGRTDKRPGFQKMMRDAQNGSFNYVIAWKSNRMGRNMLEAMQNDAVLTALGIKCLYVEENFGDTAAGRFALRNMMNVNQFYSENMAEDIRRGLNDNASQCKVTGALPIGYKTGADLRYEIDEPNAKIVREIFDRVISGWSYKDIAADLNRRGIKTKGGGRWNKGSFHRMLSNERYTGVYIYGDYRIEGGIPAIIDKETFLAAEGAANGAGTKKRSSDYLLTGKLFCGECGTAMVGVSGKGRHGEQHYYYACQKKRLEKSCKKKNIVRDQIENDVAKILSDYVLTDEIINYIADCTMKIVEEREDLAQLEQRQKDICTALTNLTTAIEAGIFTATTRDRLLELEAEKDSVASQIAATKAVNISREDVVSSMKQFREGDITDKHFKSTLFDSFLRSVHVYDDRYEIDIALKDKTVTLKGLYMVEKVPPVTDIRTLAPAIYCTGDGFVVVFPLSLLKRKI